MYREIVGVSMQLRNRQSTDGDVIRVSVDTPRPVFKNVKLFHRLK